MKILYSMFVLFAFGWSAQQLVLAQKPQNLSSGDTGKIITEDEFYTLKNQAIDKLEANDRRVKTVEEVFSGADGSFTERRTEIYESAFKSSDKMRVVKEVENAAGATTKTGFMMIGRERYEIDKTGKWVLNPRSGWGSGVGSGGGGATTDTRVYKFIGKTKFRGKPVLVYEVRGKHQTYFNDQFVETDETMRYWFSPDKKMLLREEGTNSYPALKLKVKKTVINEYNASINIQAPR